MNKRYNTILVTLYCYFIGTNKRGINQYRVYLQSNRPQNDNAINSACGDFTFENSIVTGNRNMVKRFNNAQLYILALSNSDKVALEYNVCAYSFQRIVGK